MPYRVEATRIAARELRPLPADIRQRVLAVLTTLVDEPRPSGVRKLTAQDSLYRVRVGSYRIVYEIDDTARLVQVHRIVRRSEDTYQ